MPRCVPDPLRVLGIPVEYLDVLDFSYKLPGYLAPGVSGEVLISFTPKAPVDIDTQLELLADTGKGVHEQVRAPNLPINCAAIVLVLERVLCFMDGTPVTASTLEALGKERVRLSATRQFNSITSRPTFACRPVQDPHPLPHQACPAVRVAHTRGLRRGRDAGRDGHAHLRHCQRRRAGGGAGAYTHAAGRGAVASTVSVRAGGCLDCTSGDSTVPRVTRCQPPTAPQSTVTTL